MMVDTNYSQIQVVMVFNSNDEGDSDLGDEPGVCVNDHYILASGQKAHAQDLSAFLE